MPTETETLTKDLNGYFLKNYPREAIHVIESNPIDESIEILSSQSIETISTILQSLVPTIAQEIFNSLNEKMSLELLSYMDPKDSALLLNGLNKEKKEFFLLEMKKDVSKEIKEYMEYPYDSAGSLMDSKILFFREDQTIKDISKKLKGKNISSLNSLFVVDDTMRLLGVVNIPSILFAKEEATIGSLMKPTLTLVHALDPRSDIVDIVEKHNVREIPVTDINERLLGVIRADELLDTLKEDLITSMQTMVGVSRDERALSPALFSIKKRLPWLNINLLTAFLAASVVGLFESTIAKYTALAVLLPVVAGQSGNTGAQSLAVAMRGLALREISTKEWFKLFLKEFQVGLINGLAIAIVTSISVFIWSQNYGLAIVIFLSMIVAMIIASVAGGLIPLILKKLDQDPATSSSIILTTITDVFGFFAFLGIATLLSSMLD